MGRDKKRPASDVQVNHDPLKDVGRGSVPPRQNPENLQKEGVPSILPSLNKDLSFHSKAWVKDAEELKQKEPEKFRSLFSVDANRIITRSVRNKFGWCVLNADVSKFNIPKLKLFYLLFYNSHFVEFSYEEFEAHHIGDAIPAPSLIWRGEIMILVLVYEVLIHEKGIIPEPNESFYNQLVTHWQHYNKNTKKINKLTTGSLKSSLSKAKSDHSIRKIVDDLISLLMS